MIVGCESVSRGSKSVGRGRVEFKRSNGYVCSTMLTCERSVIIGKREKRVTKVFGSRSGTLGVRG